MSDTYRRYRAIKQAIMQFYQPRPCGHREKHLASNSILSRDQNRPTPVL